VNNLFFLRGVYGSHLCATSASDIYNAVTRASRFEKDSLKMMNLINNFDNDFTKIFYNVCVDYILNFVVKDALGAGCQIFVLVILQSGRIYVVISY
jgi:hypothetical protein